jgi:O-antigen/teichoic acid export membrane protein
MEIQIFENFLKKLQVSKKFSADVMWAMSGFAVMGFCGILLNIFIAKYYGASALGVFNQVYAVFILFSQFSVAGVHLSVLKNVVRFGTDRKKSDAIISASIYLTAAISIVVFTIVFLLRDFFGYIFNSRNVAVGLAYGSPGLFFWALNKVYLAFHNACRRIKIFSFFNALRFVLLLLFLMAFIVFELPRKKLPAIISLSEVSLFSLLMLYSLKHMRFSASTEVKEWLAKHFVFGLKGALGHILMDINTRVDILILGVFASDRFVGIYSFAAMLAEGFYQLPIVFRTNVNPIITKYKFTKDAEELENIVNKGKKLFYLLLAPIGIIAIFCYPLIIKIFSLSADPLQGWPVFAILLCGILMSGGYIPFQMIFNQAGYPAYQTLFFSLIFFTNLILNLILIPVMGMIGAAVATGIAFVSQVLYIKIIAAKILKIRI